MQLVYTVRSHTLATKGPLVSTRRKQGGTVCMKPSRRKAAGSWHEMASCTITAKFQSSGSMQAGSLLGKCHLKHHLNIPLLASSGLPIVYVW